MGLIDWPVCGSFVGPVGLVGAVCFAPVVGPGLFGLSGIGPDQLPPQIGGRVVSNRGANRGAGWFGGELAPVFWFAPG